MLVAHRATAVAFVIADNSPASYNARDGADRALFNSTHLVSYDGAFGGDPEGIHALNVRALCAICQGEYAK